jgi:hypothetical protein
MTSDDTARPTAREREVVAALRRLGADAAPTAGARDRARARLRAAMAAQRAGSAPVAC